LANPEVSVTPWQKANGFFHWILDYCRKISIFEAAPQKLKINK
jgi:hypothetical protein